MKRYPLKYSMNVIGLSITVFAFLRFILPTIGAKLGLNEKFSAWLIVCGVSLIISCVLPSVIIIKMGEFPPEFLKKTDKWDNRIMPIAFSSVLIVLLATAINRLLVVLFMKIGLNPPSAEMPVAKTKAELIIYFLFLAILPAIFEEIFVRGLILGLLRQYGEKFSIIMSAFIFAFMHTSWDNLLPVFVAGLLLACAYVYIGSLWRCVTIHFLNNAFSFGIMHLENGAFGPSSPVIAVFLVMIVVVLGAFSLWLLYKSGNNYLSPLSKKQENIKISDAINAPVFLMGIFSLVIGILANSYGNFIS